MAAFHHAFVSHKLPISNTAVLGPHQRRRGNSLLVDGVDMCAQEVGRGGSVASVAIYTARTPVKRL